MKKKVLSLHSLTEDFAIEIDDRSYPLVNPAAMSLAQIQKIHRLQRRYEEVSTAMVGADATDEHAAAASRLLRELVGIVLDAPAPVLDALKDGQLFAIARTFSTLSTDAAPPTGANKDAPTPPAPSSLPTSSLDSPDSTAEVPTTGYAEPL